MSSAIRAGGHCFAWPYAAPGANADERRRSTRRRCCASSARPRSRLASLAVIRGRSSVALDTEPRARARGSSRPDAGATLRGGIDAPPRQQHAARRGRIAPSLAECRARQNCQADRNELGNSMPRSSAGTSQRSRRLAARFGQLDDLIGLASVFSRKIAATPPAAAIVRCAAGNARESPRSPAAPARRRPASSAAARRARDTADVPVMSPPAPPARPARPGNMPGTAGDVACAVAPAPVHPQPEVRMAPHVHLEHVGAALRQLADGIGRCRPAAARPDARRSSRYRPSGERQRERRHERRAGAQRERRQRGRRRRRTVEEVDAARHRLVWMCWSIRIATHSLASSARSTRRIAPCR